jgi:4-diphosphocytidyl-2-C-methyl-D-erythritol kinase
MFPVIELTDILDITKSSGSGKQKINLTTTGIKIDGPNENNLVYRAYQLLDNLHDLPPINVHLHKTIPFGAGLGGGSADGAFMLKGLNDFFDLNITDERLEHLAAKLGSDCPFFIKNKPSIATGRGEKLALFSSVNLSSYFLTIVIPTVGISTKEAYSRVMPRIPEKKLSDYLELQPECWTGNITNDFEPSVFKQKPVIERLRDELIKSGAVYVSLSGSGSAVYALHRQKPMLNEIGDEYFVWAGKL